MSDLIRVLKKKNIIPIKLLSPYIWQDECQEVFLLTKSMEIWLWSETSLGLYIFNKNVLTKLHNLGLIFDEIPQDDPCTECKTKIENLPYLLSFNQRGKKRPPKRCKWVLKMEKLLAHRILPFHIRKDEKGKINPKALEALKKWRESKKIEVK
jgi:hypothetical protein